MSWETDLEQFKRCQNLWLGVICQAFVDLVNRDKKKERVNNKKSAFLWLHKKKDFLRTCKYAGINPNFVLYVKRLILENPPEKIKMQRLTVDLKY
jgi:hypothetical protein